MSKLGRYAAQRRKVEITAEDKTAAVSDCGTVFIMTGAKTVTMPSAVAAGSGWWCRIVQGSSANSVSINVSTNMADDAASLAGVGGGAGASDGMETIAGDFVLTNNGSKGSFAELYSDGVQWYCFALSDSGNGITV
jgi:hypothetical protein